ncbi:MAG: DUF6036 family nucleotidyltransferase [Candidatus Muiribacteriota bacterium]
MFYYEIFKGFYDNNIKYLIVGGLAVNLHNVPRMTNDIDIIISTDKENVEHICNMLEKLNYKTKIPVNPKDISEPEILKEWTELKNLKALSFYNKTQPYKEIDILLVHPLNFDKAYLKKEEREFNDIKLYFVNLDDLIIMKEYSGRNQDINDLKMLKKVRDLKK